LLQLNLLSVTGYYGPGVKKTAEKLLKEGLIDLAGTDLHHERHLKALQKMPFSKEWALIANYPFKNKDLFG
jgi:tyrosine-protein phosphatase YwqE